MCIDIVEIWFGIASEQILFIFDSYLPVTHPYFRFQMITSVNINGFSRNLVCALILRRSGFGLLMGKFNQCLTELSAFDTFIFLFQTITSVNINGFSQNLLCALILWRPALEVLMGKFP